MPTRADRFIKPVERVLAALAALALLVLCTLTTVDVIGRYFLGMPVQGGFELTELLLGATIFAALPLVSLRRMHVTVDVLDAVSSPVLRRVQNTVSGLAGIVFVALSAWALWLFAARITAGGETTAMLKINLGWVIYAMSIAMFVTAIIHLLLLFLNIEDDGANGARTDV